MMHLTTEHLKTFLFDRTLVDIINSIGNNSTNEKILTTINGKLQTSLDKSSEIISLEEFQQVLIAIEDQVKNYFTYPIDPCFVTDAMNRGMQARNLKIISLQIRSIKELTQGNLH